VVSLICKNSCLTVTVARLQKTVIRLLVLQRTMVRLQETIMRLVILQDTLMTLVILQETVAFADNIVRDSGDITKRDCYEIGNISRDSSGLVIYKNYCKTGNVAKRFAI
jgi:hypothetical protein